MLMETVIKVENLSKQYRIGAREPGYRTFRETLVDSIKAPFQGIAKLINRQLSIVNRQSEETFWALRDVSFEVNRGEVVGIIGRNGAGKSTLLKILSKITEPTEGRVELRGRVGSLLEVGTGFHPELTGHENVYLYGAILGMDRWEITRKFDEIIAFAELEKFIDTPVKRYSSGMYMRLAFAVAAHLEPEILLVDEVLAVGDAAFQKKCIGKMEDVSKEGRTILFVSHNMAAITRLCERSFWIDKGTIIKEGTPSEIVNMYQSQYLTGCAQWKRPEDDTAKRSFSFMSISVLDSKGQPCTFFDGNEPVAVEILYRVIRHLSGCQIGTRVYNSEGVVVFTTADSDREGFSAVSKEPGTYRSSFIIPPEFLSPGKYYLTVASHLPFRETYEVIEQPVVFEISQSNSLASLDGRMGIVTPLIEWETLKDNLS
jgi:lipopolysaccharide transport system ATP-binding protein